MAHPFLSDPGKSALVETIRHLERGSSAEVVIAVRPRSGSYLHASLLFGILVALLTLGFLLFSPWSFGLAWFLIDPAITGVLATVLTLRSAWAGRLLTPDAARTERVAIAARAMFVAKGVHTTRDRTGILLYVSLLERKLAIVEDIGVSTALPREAWEKAVAPLRESVEQGGDALEFARAAHPLGPLLASAIPRGSDDVNELADEVAG